MNSNVMAGSQLTHSKTNFSSEGGNLMLTADYVLGLVDGEGSFAVHFNTSKRRRAKVEPRFCLKLRAEDRILLEELREFFGCGRIYIQRDRRPNHSLCYRFEVSNRQELFEKIIPFFDQHPPRSPSKQRDFGFFRQVLFLVRQGEHLTTEGLEKIEQLASQMHLGSLRCARHARPVGTRHRVQMTSITARQATKERDGRSRRNKAPTPDSFDWD